MKKSLFLAVIVALVIASCKNDDDATVPFANTQIPQNIKFSVQPDSPDAKGLVDFKIDSGLINRKVTYSGVAVSSVDENYDLSFTKNSNISIDLTYTSLENDGLLPYNVALKIEVNGEVTKEINPVVSNLGQTFNLKYNFKVL